MAEATEEIHIQATFFTDKERITVPSTPFSLPLSATRDDLTQLINQLLSSSDDVESSSKFEFDFLVNSSLLRNTLGQLIQDLQLSKESVVQIECVERTPPPSLDNQYPHNDWVSAVHCTEDHILTGCYDSTVRVWSTSNGDCLAEGTGHEREISSIAWLPKSSSHDNHMFVSGSHDQHARIWEYNEKTREISCLIVCKGHSNIIEALTIAPNEEKFCTGGVDKLLKVWSSQRAAKDDDDDNGGERTKKPRLMENKKLPSRTPLVTLSGHTHPIMCLKWTTGNRILSGGYDHCIREWDIESGVNINTMNGSKVFLSIDKSHDGHVIASGHTDKHVRLWDSRISSGSLVTSMLSSHRGWVRRVCWSPDHNHQLVSGSYDGTAKLWDTRSPNTPLYTITAHEDKLLCLDWSVSKFIASGGSDNTLRRFTF